MSAMTPEERLWKVSGVETDQGGTVPPDDVLRAYRAGRLPAPELERIERVLCRSARARERLAELAGTSLAVPRARIRRRVLESERASRWRWPVGRAGSAAALLALAALGSFGYHWLSPDRAPAVANPIPPGLEFDVRVEGLSVVRSSPGTTTALPGTTIRITVEPRQDAAAGLEFGIYTLRSGSARRLAPSAGLRLETARGAAVFTATAERLVGDAPGTHELFLVAAREGALPEAVTLYPDRPVDELLAAASGGRVYRRTLTLLHPTR